MEVAAEKSRSATLAEIFRHGPIIIYTRLPAGGTYYPICMFPTNSECLIGISDAFSAFCLWVSVIFPTCSLYPPKKQAYCALHPQAWTYIYTGPCPKALTECSPMDFRRSSIPLPHPQERTFTASSSFANPAQGSSSILTQNKAQFKVHAC